MPFFSKTTLLAALIVPAAAFAGLDTGQSLGTTDTDVRAALIGLGYDVHEIEVETGKIEAEASLNGVAYEVYVARDTGQIIKIEVEDDETDSDD